MKTDKLLQLIASANKDSKPLRRLQVGGQSYTSDSAYDLYKQTPPVVEYDPRATPEFQDLKKQYDRVQSRINTFVPVDPYVGNLRKTAAKLIEDQVTVENTDYIPDEIKKWRNPETGGGPAYCISGSCYLAEQAGDKSFKFFSNDLAQTSAMNRSNGRYLEQDEKFMEPGDIIQFKRNTEKGGPHHAYTVLELEKANDKGVRKIKVAGSSGGGPLHYNHYYLGPNNKVYDNEDLSSLLATQLLKRITPKLSDAGGLIKERDALKMKMDEIDSTYFAPERQGRNINNRTTQFFFDKDAWKGGNPEKFNYDEPDRDTTYTEGKTPGETINPKDAKLFDMMGKYSDNGYKTKFMEDHNISGPEYDAIVKNMFGIYGAETKFGTDNWAGSKFPEPRWLTDTLGVGESVGPFQLGRKNFSKKLKDKYTRKELHDPMIASEATLEFLAENLPLLRKRALDTPEQSTYTKNITQDNYLEFIPYLHNAQSWLRGDKETLKKKKDVVRGDHDYKKLVDFYASKFQAIPISIEGDGPVIEDYRYDSEWSASSNVMDKKQRGGQAIKVSDKNDPRLKAYNDSNLLYNVSNRRELQFNKDPFDSRLNEYGEEVDGLAKRLRMNPIAYRQGWDSSNFTEFPFNSPDAEYYLQSDEPYIAKYKKPVQPYVYDPNIPLMQKKGVNPINFITPDPVKVKNAKTSNNWYMDTRGEWTNVPLQQYIHGANKFQEGGSAYDPTKMINQELVQHIIQDNPVTTTLGKVLNKTEKLQYPLNFMGQPYATGDVEESISPLDFIGGIRGGIGLVKGLFKLSKSLKPNYVNIGGKMIDLGVHPKSVNRAVNEINKGARNIVLPNSFQLGGGYNPITGFTPALVQEALKRMNSAVPVTNTLGNPITPTKTAHKTRESFLKKSPDKYNIEDYKAGHLEPGLENDVLSDPIAMASALAAGGVGLGAYGVSQLPKAFVQNLASEATMGVSDLGKILIRKPTSHGTIGYSPEQIQANTDALRNAFLDGTAFRQSPAQIQKKIEAIEEPLLNRSTLSKRDVKEKLKRLREKNQTEADIDNIPDDEFYKTVYKPTGELTPYVHINDIPDSKFIGPYKGLQLGKTIPMKKEDYVAKFNANIDELNKIISENNKTNVKYNIKRLDNSGLLTIETPPQKGHYKLTPEQVRTTKMKHKDVVSDIEFYKGELAKESLDDMTMRMYNGFINNLDDDRLRYEQMLKDGEGDIVSGNKHWSVNINPGEWTGEVDDIANTEYYEGIPGLDMASTGDGIFADGIERKGSGAYKSINAYLKSQGLGRVKTGFNSQTPSSRELWEKYVKSKKAYGFYNDPHTIHGVMKTLPPAVAVGTIGYQQSQNDTKKTGGSVIKINKNRHGF